MKKALKIYQWVIIAFILQWAFLLTINTVLSSSEGISTFKTTAVGETGKQKTDMELKVSGTVGEIKVSYDGNYAGYVLDKKIIIADMKSGKNKKTISPENNQISYFRWLPDRDMMIYAICDTSSGKGVVQIFTYDVEGDIERSYPKITGLAKDSRVEDIELSPQTNVVYAKINTSSTNAVVYKFNIMNNLSYIMALSAGAVIKETAYSDKLVYQDGKNKLYVRDGNSGSTWSFPFKQKMVLLEVDSEDQLYAGELDSAGMVVKIHYGKLTVEPDKAWNEIPLRKGVLPENICITGNGSVYELLKSESSVLHVQEANRMKYRGTFIEMLDDYVVTFDNNRIKLSLIRSDADNLKQ